MKAQLYRLVITETQIGGNIIERRMQNSEDSDTSVQVFNDRTKGLFQFVQTEDGSVPVVLHSREEDSEITNLKKAIVSAFQANFWGTTEKEEADPQSLHKAKYT